MLQLPACSDKSIMDYTNDLLASKAMEEDKPRLGRENRPYIILSTLEHLEDYDRLCLNGPPIVCYGETTCKVALIACPQNNTCEFLKPICTDKALEDLQERKFKYTSSKLK
uniref:Uncharacterized protein n=1 Tax=Caenorhabditis japonica TaxID=281687 RepID=A0A8R1DIG0_CAEJA